MDHTSHLIYVATWCIEGTLGITGHDMLEYMNKLITFYKINFDILKNGAANTDRNFHNFCEFCILFTIEVKWLF